MRGSRPLLGVITSLMDKTLSRRAWRSRRLGHTCWGKTPLLMFGKVRMFSEIPLSWFFKFYQDR